MKKLLWILIFFGGVNSLTAQNIPRVYNQFFMNPYVYNPAYAGVEGHSVIFAMYKDQWGQIDGAPTLSHINFHIPIRGGLAFGAMAYNESAGLYTQSGGKISAGYLVSIDREHHLRFGLSLGAGNTMMNYGEFDSPTDPAFRDLAGTEAFMIGDVGVAYHFGHFNVGLSLPTLFEHNAITRSSELQANFKPQDNALIKMNYRGHLSDDVAIEPHLLYRYSKYLPDQFEAAVIFHVLHIVWVGGTYRQNAGFVGLIGAKFWEKMAVGYAYEYGSPNTASLLGPTHEIHLGLHINKKDHHAHSSSFIKSHRLSAEERAREAELERQKKLQALQQSRQNKEDEDELSLVASAKKEEPEPVANNWNYEKESEPISRVNQFGEEERGIRFERTNENGEKEVVFSWLPPPPEGSTEETYEIANPDEEPLIRTRPNGTKEAGIKWVRTIDGGDRETLIIWDPILPLEEANKMDHNKAEEMSMGDAKISIRREEPVEPAEDKPVVQEKEPEPEVIEQPAQTQPDDIEAHDEYADTGQRQVAKRGNHMLELRVGNYVVAGVFKEFWNAEDFSDKLFQRGFHDTKVGHLSETGFYYVVITSSDNLSQVTREKNRIKNYSGLSKVWVLTVEE